MTNSGKKAQANFEAALLALSLDRTAAQPLHAQLSEGLRRLILSGPVPGLRIPPSRQLAADLSVSRATALAALDQLAAEGYLETRQGAGTFVAHDLPPAPAQAPRPGGLAAEGPQPVLPFDDLPDLAAFPHADWARHLEASWRRPEPGLLDVPDRFGWPPLRAAIAAHLGAWRGITCGPGQVIVTSGVVESVQIVARLLPAGAQVHVEAPGYAAIVAGLRSAGLRDAPLPVDGEGIDISRLSAEARAAVVTPSRQFPLGMTLPLARRLALLDWAERTGAVVVEDDFDSEFRYTGAPLPALASLDGSGRVIYAGSFSKLIGPGLRLGYLVFPERLAHRLGEVRSQASLLAQPALARFMQSGGFATHLRRMRRLYGQRRKVLTEALAPLADLLEPDRFPSGMHLVCRLKGAVRDVDVAVQAENAGLRVRALSGYAHAPEGLNGLVLGFAAFDDATLRLAAERLGRVLRLGG